MQQPDMTPEQHFAIVVAELLDNPGVTPPAGGRKFGASALKIHGKIFAMLYGGGMVVKLPRARVIALLAAGSGVPFDPRRDGRGMKEWIVVDHTAPEDWVDLAHEALQFVSSQL